MERINNRYLTDEEAAKYDKIRQQIAEELPELIKRHNERMAAKDAQAKDEEKQSEEKSETE